MQKKLIIVMYGIFLILLFSGNGYTDSGQFAVSARASTLGLGAEVIAGITSHLNARVGFNAFQYDYDSTESDIEYALDLQLQSFSALLDWHPFAGSFHITGGALLNKNKIDMLGESTASYTIGNTTYTAADVGTLSGDFDFNNVAPYAGIGWGNPLGKDRRWGFVFDVGVLFQGSPKVDLTANGLLSSDSAFLADLAREEEDLKSEVDEYKYYPVISVGVFYKF